MSTLEGSRRRCRTLWKALNTRAFQEPHSSRTLFAMLACVHSDGLIDSPVGGWLWLGVADSHAQPSPGPGEDVGRGEPPSR